MLKTDFYDIKSNYVFLCPYPNHSLKHGRYLYVVINCDWKILTYIDEMGTLTLDSS